MYMHKYTHIHTQRGIYTYVGMHIHVTSTRVAPCNAVTETVGWIVFASSSLGDNRQTYSGVALSSHRRTLNYLCVTCGHRLYLPLGDKIFKKSVLSLYSICIFSCVLCVPLPPPAQVFTIPRYPLLPTRLPFINSLSLSLFLSQICIFRPWQGNKGTVISSSILPTTETEFA